ncbi:VOC family protein [Amycolatopsis carbonis]|uniref:VOC family protein n=1 Tax=Amycolatopsis carbonis TaxID=715471 RepID=A0A9Y2IJ24_9PSEU|nr:VOC family protein [Amycolatopsis sp. 2-15]WIX79243.1 VOC family protein [Amycolatopsis sp. 2-15]
MAPIDLSCASAFWSAALGLEVSPEWDSGNWRTLRQRSGGDRVLGLMRSSSPVERRPRLHLDLVLDTADEQRSEVERLVALGARHVDWDSYPLDPDFVVLADPEGNVFCVVDLSRAPSGSGGL